MADDVITGLTLHGTNGVFNTTLSNVGRTDQSNAEEVFNTGVSSDDTQKTEKDLTKEGKKLERLKEHNEYQNNKLTNEKENLKKDIDDLKKKINKKGLSESEKKKLEKELKQKQDELRKTEKEINFIETQLKEIKNKIKENNEERDFFKLQQKRDQDYLNDIYHKM